jgi:hypothetical protein
LKSFKSIFDLDLIINLLSNTSQSNYKIEMSRRVLECYKSIENNLFVDDISKYLMKIATIYYKSDDLLTNHKGIENSQKNIKGIESAECNNDSTKDYLAKRLIQRVELMDKKIEQKLILYFFLHLINCEKFNKRFIRYFKILCLKIYSII